MTAKTKILIVEDDKDYAKATGLVLESAAYDVFYAENADQGLDLVKKTGPDLIVLDVMMRNRADGMLFARRLRGETQYEAYKKVPILVMTSMREQTGYWFPGEPKNSVFFPIDEIVEKPVKPEILLAKIKSLLAKEASKS